ncbi:MAG: hypothetical protein ABR582_07050 [Gemmatimonadaceae bacterium]
MRPAIFAASLLLLTASCTVEKKTEDVGGTDAEGSAAAAATAAPAMVLPASPTNSKKAKAALDSVVSARKPAAKKSTSRDPAMDSMHDSAFGASLEIGPDGKVRKVKK